MFFSFFFHPAPQAPKNKFRKKRKVIGAEEKKQEIARIMTLEQGKILSEAVGEVVRAIDSFQWNGEQAKKINDYKYVIEDTISIIGQFGIAINTFDKIQNQPFNFGIYEIELFIDNELLYSINFDKYNFTQDNLIYNEIDYYLLQEGSVFHRLFYSNKNKLNFIEKNNPFILLDNNCCLKSGEVSIKIFSFSKK